jgi:hypothetical protein
MWELSYRADREASAIADRHYSRQTVGSVQFVPPGRCLCLYQPGAVWVSSWPFAEYVKHRWAGAWVCSLFRNESAGLSSALIREAIAVTRWRWSKIPALGMVSFVDPAMVRHKRDPGRCFMRAGFRRLEQRTAGGLLVFQLLPASMPEPLEPCGITADLFATDAKD